MNHTHKISVHTDGDDHQVHVTVKGFDTLGDALQVQGVLQRLFEAGFADQALNYTETPEPDMVMFDIGFDPAAAYADDGDLLDLFVPLVSVAWPMPALDLRVLQEVAWRRGCPPWDVAWNLVQPVVEYKAVPRTVKAFEAMVRKFASSVEPIAKDMDMDHVFPVANGKLSLLIEESLSDESDLLDG